MCKIYYSKRIASFYNVTLKHYKKLNLQRFPEHPSSPPVSAGFVLLDLYSRFRLPLWYLETLPKIGRCKLL